MKVVIKSFDVAMVVKQKGIELEVRSPDGKNHHGDCFVTMTGLIWCPGRTTKANGIKITWDQLQELCASKKSLREALRAVRKT